MRILLRQVVGTGGAPAVVLAVASQLAPAAPREATRLRGSAESHVAILRSPDVAAALNEGLTEGPRTGGLLCLGLAD